MCMLVSFFKQKTAYVMRIWDWTSDVCSSDLHLEARPGTVQCTEKSLVAGIAGVGGEDAGDAAAVIVRPVCVAGVEAGALLLWIAGFEVLGEMPIGRASCRKECVSTVRSRWSPFH